MNIPFNKPHATGRELSFIKQAIDKGHVSGNGYFTKKCHELFEANWGIKNSLLTTSCTDALEMSAMLLNLKQGDEVIVPSYTFVSTALAFSREGARIVFADSRKENPCIDEKRLEPLISENTKAIVPVHYGGMACDMDAIMKLAQKYKLWVVEDAAHSFGGSYKGKLLGTIGHLGCFSFHETKIVHCGEGGLLAVNHEPFLKRAEVLWEKGTNRSAFHRGDVQKYEWVDTGSSFLLSDINAAYLYAQLVDYETIQEQRKMQWETYFNLLKKLEEESLIELPIIPENTVSNYSGFYLIAKSLSQREALRKKLNFSGIQAVSHYLDLELSPYIQSKQNKRNLSGKENSMKYQDQLLRLPLYNDLKTDQIKEITDSIINFYSI